MTVPEKKKGDPTAVGIFSYGFTLFFLSVYAMGFYPWSESILMIAPALFFGGLFLLIAANCITTEILLVQRHLRRIQRSFLHLRLLT